jgi:hypothetical protein
MSFNSHIRHTEGASACKVHMPCGIRLLWNNDMCTFPIALPRNSAGMAQFRKTRSHLKLQTLRAASSTYPPIIIWAHAPSPGFTPCSRVHTFFGPSAAPRRTTRSLPRSRRARRRRLTIFECGVRGRRHTTDHQSQGHEPLAHFLELFAVQPL